MYHCDLVFDEEIVHGAPKNLALFLDFKNLLEVVSNFLLYLYRLGIDQNNEGATFVR